MLNRVNIHAAKYHNKDKIGHEKFETDSTLMRIPAGTRIQKEQNEDLLRLGLYDRPENTGVKSGIL